MMPLVIRLIALAIAWSPLAAAALSPSQAETLIAGVRAQGFLSAPVRVRQAINGERTIGLVMSIEDDFSCTLILNPNLFPGNSLVPPDRRADPLVEEFMLLHELAHCEHAQLPRMFRSGHASERVNRAYHDFVLLAPWSQAVALFKEMFADVYAASGLLARHRYSDEALALLEDIVRWRQASETLAPINWRIHATAPALRALLVRLERTAGLSPEALQDVALEIASDAFLASVPKYRYAGQAAPIDYETLSSIRYVGWMWSAASGGVRDVRSFEHYRRVAVRLDRPMDDLLMRMRTFVILEPSPDAMRAFVDELRMEVENRLEARAGVPDRGRARHGEAR